MYTGKKLSRLDQRTNLGLTLCYEYEIDFGKKRYAQIDTMTGTSINTLEIK